MSDLNQKYDKILLELKQNIKDKNEYEFVKNKFSELTMMFIDSMDKLLEIEERQKKMDKKLKGMQEDLERIEDDIYIDDDEEDECDSDCGCHDCDEHEDDCEFEIVCPYCDYEFVADSDFEDKDEIECPKCHNIIELDWEDECDGACECCSGHCSSEDSSEDTSKNAVAENDEKYKLDNSKNEKSNNDSSEKKNEDDM